MSLDAPLYVGLGLYLAGTTAVILLEIGDIGWMVGPPSPGLQTGVFKHAFVCSDSKPVSDFVIATP